MTKFNFEDPQKPKKTNYWNLLIIVIIVNVYFELFHQNYFYLDQKAIFLKIQIFKKFLKLANIPFISLMNTNFILCLSLYILMLKVSKYVHFLLIPLFLGFTKSLIIITFPYLQIVTCFVLFLENIHPVIILSSLIIPYTYYNQLILYIITLKYSTLIKLNSKQINVFILLILYLISENYLIILAILPIFYQFTSKYFNYFFRIFLGCFLLSYSILKMLNFEKIYFSTSIPLIFLFFRYK